MEAERHESGNNTNKITLSYTIEEYVHPEKESNQDLKHTWKWTTLLSSESSVVAAPVQIFAHAPLSNLWEHIIVGMKVEVETNRTMPCTVTPPTQSSSASSATSPAFNTSPTAANVAPPQSTQSLPVFWVASVLRLVGYYALLRFEGFGQDSSHDFWLHVCSEKIRPVGWCCTRGRSLAPPKHIQNKYCDWKDFLIKRLTGTRTIPQGFYNRVCAHVKSKFKIGMKLEVVDKMRVCQMRVATVKDITGRRMYLEYDDLNHSDIGFWCHERSSLIHPVGWSRRVGHQIVASDEYHQRCVDSSYISGVDCTDDMFPHVASIEQLLPEQSSLSDVMTTVIDCKGVVKDDENEDIRNSSSFSLRKHMCYSLCVGMKLEAVDPLNLATICVATVMKVLRFGYVMIRIDGYEADETNSDWFCYHSASSLLFPPGFCDSRKIKLKSPLADRDAEFIWNDYLTATGSKGAPPSIFQHHISKNVPNGESTDQQPLPPVLSPTFGPLLQEQNHGFKIGMKLEATDEMDPRLICVATVCRVIPRSKLIRIHFDGWDEEYDQWMSVDSVDFYPLGWCQLVGHRLEPPRKASPPSKKEKNQQKGHGSKGGSNGGGSKHNTASSSSNNTTGTGRKRTFSNIVISNQKAGQQNDPTTTRKSSSPHFTSVSSSTEISDGHVDALTSGSATSCSSRATSSIRRRGGISSRRKAAGNHKDLNNTSIEHNVVVGNEDGSIGPSSNIIMDSLTSSSILTPSVGYNECSEEIKDLIDRKDEGAPDDRLVDTTNRLGEDHQGDLKREEESTNSDTPIKEEEEDHQNIILDDNERTSTTNGSFGTPCINANTITGTQYNTGCAAKAPPMAVIRPNVHNTTTTFAENELTCFSASSNFHLPKLIDIESGVVTENEEGESGGGSSSATSITPQLWSVDDLGQFFEINDCGSIVDAFKEHNVDGNRFINDLTKANIMEIVQNKIGPCLKIENLLNLLKNKMRLMEERSLSHL